MCIHMHCDLEYVFFFFFKAEDGIRDKLVTGVQTCALPICRHHDRHCFGLRDRWPRPEQWRSWCRRRPRRSSYLDRESGGEGKRVDLGGGRIIKKKKKKKANSRPRR